MQRSIDALVVLPQGWPEPTLQWKNMRRAAFWLRKYFEQGIFTSRDFHRLGYGFPLICGGKPHVGAVSRNGRGVCAQQSPLRISSPSKHGTGLRGLASGRSATNVIVNNTARRSQLQCRAHLVHSKAFGLTAVALEARRGVADSSSL